VVLYNLKIEDPTSVRQDVEYLLESDRFICAPKGYEVIYFFYSKGLSTITDNIPVMLANINNLIL
jgi:hypothetical protein